MVLHHPDIDLAGDGAFDDEDAWLGDVPPPVPSRVLIELDVRLAFAEIAPWRRIAVSDQATLEQLAWAIIEVCGWHGSHLWKFQATGDGVPMEAIAGIPDPEGWNAPAADAAQVPMVSHLSAAGDAAAFLYDFGDGWLHDLKVVGRREVALPTSRLLLDGALAFPPEDSGGIDGYERCLALRRTGEDPRGEDTDGLREWLGEWQPDTFDLGLAQVCFDTPVR